MSANNSAQGPNRSRPASWSELPKVQQIAMISTLAIVALCCGILLLPDADDDDSPGEVGTVIETTASASPTEPDPTTRASPTEAATSASPEPPPETTEAEEEEVYYENCDAVRDAGAAPIYDGEPGYRAGLDGDGDGEGCEDSSGSDSGSGGGGNDDDDDDGESVYYKNCDAVRAAGAAPIHSGEPGYGSHLDRDGDGTGCE
ncbi:excalibur calcium-binding domain-containing protein [Glycomyces sp. YM15]|uniref:excalibur calcium-binding domain-containing protein n=1 Tax=Glycomyces sp. YM15 TaxID=2800446 RepID=UPI0027DEA152|nr:excalibur calcium-binding domain-containing protein [Glycomyces sp. YM15]